MAEGVPFCRICMFAIQLYEHDERPTKKLASLMKEFKTERSPCWKGRLCFISLSLQLVLRKKKRGLSLLFLGVECGRNLKTVI